MKGRSFKLTYWKYELVAEDGGRPLAAPRSHRGGLAAPRSHRARGGAVQMGDPIAGARSRVAQEVRARRRSRRAWRGRRARSIRGRAGRGGLWSKNSIFAYCFLVHACHVYPHAEPRGSI
jgi:hypothetical protein